MEKKKGSLMLPIVGSIIIAVFVTAISIVLFSVFNSISSTSSQTAAYEERLLGDIKTELKNETQEAMSVCEFMYQKYQAGEISMEKAKQTAADIIRDMRYNDGDGYFWVDTAAGVNVVLLGRDTEGKSRWDAVDPNGTYYIQEMIKNGMQDGGGYTKLMFAKPNETEPLPKINYTAYYKPFDWVMGTGVWVDYIDALTETYKSNAYAALNSTVIQSVVIFLVLLAIGVAVAIFMGKRITSPIILATNQMMKMSDNDFTDTDEIDKLRGLKGRNNEIGQISCALDSMHNNIRELMHTISDTTSYVASAAEELSANASQSAKASEMVAVSCTSVADSCSGQITAVSGVSEQTKNFVDNMQEFKDAIGRTAEMIDSTNEAATKGASDMTNATNMMGLIKDSVENTAGVVETLGEQLKNIDSFVETISEIADQTNLLSLNASIEAARAGEMGKGFAVVASEISKLAEQSNGAASKITELIAEIMQSSNEAVESMRAGAQSVSEGTDTVNEAGNTFSNIVDMVHSISEQSARMSQIVVQLAEGTDSIANNIQQIESMSINVADETQNVSAASEEQTASTHEVAEASDKLAENAMELQNYVSRFKL